MCIATQHLSAVRRMHSHQIVKKKKLHELIELKSTPLLACMSRGLVRKVTYSKSPARVSPSALPLYAILKVFCATILPGKHINLNNVKLCAIEEC